LWRTVFAKVKLLMVIKLMEYNRMKANGIKLKINK